MKLNQHIKLLFVSLVYIICNSGCKKLVDIPAPETTITTSQVFTDSSNIAAAVSGIYSEIGYTDGNAAFCNGAETVYCGISADELVPFSKDATGGEFQMYVNELLSGNGVIKQYFWSQPYKYIYRTNACIEGISSSTSVAESVRNRFLGEAKFLRALFYFYLVNLYGDVPYLNSTEWKTTSLQGRTSQSAVYEKIIEDLKDAQALLPADYLFSDDHRTRANHWAATALLARVYLYTGNWAEAETLSGSLINNVGLFHLMDSLNDVFTCDNSESILQWELNTNYGTNNVTREGSLLVPATESVPIYYVSDQLLQAFEPADLRRIKWIDSINYENNDYFVAYKYKLGPSQREFGAGATEYTTVLRLAEQYLIRAEARARQGNLDGAADDLNIIRNRAGLANANAATQDEMMDAIIQERRIEMFAEAGHRWLDLKRTGRIDSVMSAAVPQKFGGSTWNSYQQWYPIPMEELETNPNLTQNQGYN